MPTLARNAHRPRWWLAVLGVWLALLPAAGHAEPDSAPIPRLDTGAHTAPIKRIAVDRDGRWLVSASHDKTARVWDLRSGELLQVLRPPLGRDANEGKLYAVALSPDGATVALGGFTGPDGGPFHVYLFDRASGTLRRALGGLPDAVHHLAWSPDGRRLAATLNSGGLRVYAPADGREVYADADYGAASYGADFAADGRLLTTSYDGRLRRYRPSGEGYVREASVSAPGGRRPFFARFAPDGRRLAVGYADSTRVDVLDAATLAPLPGLAATAGIDNGSLGSVAWSRDGRTLYAAGRYVDDGRNLLIRWAGGGRGPRTAVALATDTVMNLVALADGGLAFGAADPLWGVLGADGRVRRYGGGQIADFRGREGDLRVDAAATRVDFVYGTAAADLARQAHTACFDLPARRLAAGPCAGELRAADTAGQPRAEWEDTTTPRLDGRALTLWPGDTSYSLAVTDRGFVLGANWHVYAFARDGTPRWRQPLPGTAWAVNVSGDGRHVVAALGDGTLRWYADRGERAEEVLALYLHPDGERWIAWTPQGFFDASGADAEALFGYHLNHGPAQAGEFVRASQLRERFLNPELIAHRLDADGDERLAQAVAQLGDVRQVLAGAPPPKLRVIGNDVRVDAARGTARIPLVIDGEADLAALKIVVNGGSELKPRAADASGGKVYVVLDLPSGTTSQLGFTVPNARGTRSETVRFDVTMPGQPNRPALHVLAIGISEYRDSGLRHGVEYAKDDARTIASRLAERGGALYREINPRPLLNADASRTGIETALREAVDRVQPQDVFVLYLAGHGTAEGTEYFFVPQEAIQRNREALLAQSLSGTRLRELLAAIPASKKLLLLDTCASGVFIPPTRSPDLKTAAELLGRKSGFAILAAADGERYALESAGHGVFTTALLEALDGKAADLNGLVRIGPLADYVEERVPELTLRDHRVEQHPVRQFNGQNFELATARGRP